MKKQQSGVISRRLAQRLPQLKTGRHLAYLPPAEHLLQGIHFDGSSFNASVFYVHAFCMPLYVPSDSIQLSIGFRLRNDQSELWSIDAPTLMDELPTAVESQCLPFWNLSRTPLLLAKYCLARQALSNLRTQEVIALSYCIAGDIGEGRRRIECIAGSANRSTKWEAEIAARADTLLSAGSITKMNEVLLSWESYTMQNLKGVLSK
jgi:hypothetical protein